MNFTVDPSDSQLEQYQGLIRSLRNAVSTPYRQGVNLTQATANEQDANLIGMTLTDTGRTDPTIGGNPSLTLWFTADNLYLRGWTNVQGRTYYFTEPNNPVTGTPGYNLLNAFQTTVQGATFPQQYSTAPVRYSGGYNSLASTSGQTRNTISLGWGNFYNSFYSLAYAGVNGFSNAGTAASVLVMIQYFSEAARFNDVYGHISSQVQQFQSVQILPVWMQYMENRWGAMSNYGVNITNGNNAQPLNVPGMDPNGSGGSQTFTSFADLVRFLAVMLNPGEFNDPSMGGPSGNWNYDEL
jgi:hypothetical protein